MRRSYCEKNSPCPSDIWTGNIALNERGMTAMAEEIFEIESGKRSAMSRSSARLASAFVLGMSIFTSLGTAHADGVNLGCEPDACGTVMVPPCTTCDDHTIGHDGGAGAPGKPLVNGDDD